MEKPIVSNHPFYIRNMLQQYNRQLTAARKLSRYRQALRLIADRPSDVSPDAKRNALVERVAREIFENVLFTGNNTPMVQEVQKALNQEFGKDFIFQYLPGSLDLVILKRTAKGTEVVSKVLRADILERAWIITLKKVNENMV